MVSRETSAPVARLLERAAAMGVPLGPDAAAQMIGLLDRIALEPQNLTAIEGVDAGIDRHLADSLAGLTLPEVADAEACVDVGSGAGFPGLALALARPAMRVTLIESEGRKADWLRRASAAIPNVRVVSDRSEHVAAQERERAPLVTMRALGPLPTALELAAPLVAVGGCVVAWRGDDADPELEAQAARAAQELGLTPQPPRPVSPFPGARRRLQRFRKTAPTPARYPRRPGRAAKRPLGAR
ncbi:16S rRNA (guanine(527)-N(7))-methyltransferase RsmG [Miltoncostaea marina]|uniref:16S rRNA (guanine(527)-N(7))-methyltransferase RsmG n=1 Tax=Miltoncostaea marina TaxID=2843215 RepID=UPI001C3C5346|nr:16S rRNA (guanine(527)-N(7))-methyltransferase RsmG [Miltoncostaea marina]